jgi:hypothetical protein
MVSKVDAPWYMPNRVNRRDLQTPTVKEEIRRYSSQYSTAWKERYKTTKICISTDGLSTEIKKVKKLNSVD